MNQTLIKNADAVLTMADSVEMNGADILVQDGAIAAVGSSLEVPDGAEILNAQGCIVTHRNNLAGSATTQSA